MRKSKLKIKKSNVLFLIILFVSIVCIVYSTYKILTWKKENEEIDKILEKIIDVTKPIEKEDTKQVEYIEKGEIPKTDPFWQFKDMNLLHVDFQELKNINSKTVGWIEVKGTNVNMPYVQTSNNSYYLNHSFDNSYNSAGWAFLDYRNNKKELDKNNIIYAHGRKNGSMFGSLRNLLKKDWQSDKSNYVIRTSTEFENTLWQIISVYYLPTTNDYIQVIFKDNDDFLKFIKLIINRSMFNFNTMVNENDKILTLSTCYSSSEKLVVHAKLIKKEAK